MSIHRSEAISNQKKKEKAKFQIQSDNYAEVIKAVTVHIWKFPASITMNTR